MAYGRDPEGVAGAVAAFLEQAEQRQVAVRLARCGDCSVVGAVDGLGDRREPGAARGRAQVREPAGQVVVGGVEEVRLEELAADVALDGAQADTAHRLHERLLCGLAPPRESGGGIVGEALACPPRHRVRVYRRRAEAQEHREMVT